MTHRSCASPLARCACWLLLASSAGLARAEAPMVTDDAGTLATGGAKVEGQWARDGKTRAMGLTLGYGPLENLETAVSFGRARDHSTSPASTLNATGLTFKWVPWKLGEQTAMGVRLDYGVERADNGGGRVRGTQVVGLFSHEFGDGLKFHANLGRGWARASGGVNAASNVWAVGLDVPLGSEKFSLVGDLYGESGGAPTGRQIGLRWRAAEGVALSVAVGRRDGESQVVTVGAFEF